MLPRLALIATASIILLQGCAGFGPPQRKGPSVLVVAGGGGLTAMFYDCVQHYRQQGLTIKQAMGQCVAIGVARQSGAGGQGLSAAFFSGDTELGAVGIQCKSLSVDPRTAGIVDRPLPHSDEPSDLSRDPGRPLLGAPGSFENIYDSYAQLIGRLSVDFSQEVLALRARAKATTDPTQKKILNETANLYEDFSNDLVDVTGEMAAWYRDRMAEYEASKKKPPSPPGDYPLPDPEAPQVANVAPDQVSACQNMAQFVNDCRLAGWQTSPCQMFLDKLDGCGDPRVTDPSPDEERPCKSQRVSQEEARRVAFLVCSKTTTPGPDSNPCSGNLAEGKAYPFLYGKNNPNAPICSNPFAYTTAESCTATFTVIVGTQQGAESVIAEANRRLGGPIFVVPSPSPLDPKTGGCSGDPRCTP